MFHQGRERDICEYLCRKIKNKKKKYIDNKKYIFFLSIKFIYKVIYIKIKR